MSLSHRQHKVEHDRVPTLSEFRVQEEGTEEADKDRWVKQILAIQNGVARQYREHKP